jgi:hypothetical protein
MRKIEFLECEFILFAGKQNISGKYEKYYENINKTIERLTSLKNTKFGNVLNNFIIDKLHEDDCTLLVKFKIYPSQYLINVLMSQRKYKETESESESDSDLYYTYFFFDGLSSYEPLTHMPSTFVQIYVTNINYF